MHKSLEVNEYLVEATPSQWYQVGTAIGYEYEFTPRLHTHTCIHAYIYTCIHTYMHHYIYACTGPRAPPGIRLAPRSATSTAL